MNEDSPICIIGARKCSKRLAEKNKLLINDLPLYMYTLRAAVNSTIFKKIIFSTDDETIINDLKYYKEIILDNRSSEMSTDSVSMMDVTHYLMDKYNQYFIRNKSIAVMTPCNPLRNSYHICNAHKLYLKNNALSLVSITEFPSPIERPLEINNNRVYKSWDGRVDTSKFIKHYYPNGAIVIANQKHFIECQSFYSNNTIGYVLNWPFSLDINNENDYHLAKTIIENNFFTDM